MFDLLIFDSIKQGRFSSNYHLLPKESGKRHKFTIFRIRRIDILCSMQWSVNGFINRVQERRKNNNATQQQKNVFWRQRIENSSESSIYEMLMESNSHVIDITARANHLIAVFSFKILHRTCHHSHRITDRESEKAGRKGTTEVGISDYQEWKTDRRRCYVPREIEKKGGGERQRKAKTSNGKIEYTRKNKRKAEGRWVNKPKMPYNNTNQWR